MRSVIMLSRRTANGVGCAWLLTALLLTLTGQAALAAVTVLSTFDTADLAIDIDPERDNTASCSGCWYQRSNGSGLAYDQSTTPGTFTTGDGSLELNITGLGSGGEFQSTINGVAVDLDTHFDAPAAAIFADTDPRFADIQAAVAAPALTTIKFDLIYDIEQMRSIAWQPPEETVDPEGNGQYPTRFFWVGMLGQDNAGTFTYTGFDENGINVFDEQWDDDPYPVFEAEFPLTDFNLDPTATNYTFGILYNSVFGTASDGDASGNTEAARIYIDNFRLDSVNIPDPPPFGICDNDLTGRCTFDLFMSQHLVDSPTLGDFDNDGDNDLDDLNQFNTLLAQYYGQSHSTSIPEPASLLLLLPAWGAVPRRRG